jgi:hypothetical protein
MPATAETESEQILKGIELEVAGVPCGRVIGALLGSMPVRLPKEERLAYKVEYEQFKQTATQVALVASAGVLYVHCCSPCSQV